MIDRNTYISILFSIVLTVVSIYIPFILKKHSNFRKRNLLFILLFCLFALISFATLLYCINEDFCISGLLPFANAQFSDPLFNAKYKKYFIIYWGIHVGTYSCILSECNNEIGIRPDGSVAFDMKYAIITLIFYFFIDTYVHIWLIYLLCYLPLKFFINVIILLTISCIEFYILYSINKFLAIRKERLFLGY